MAAVAAVVICGVIVIMDRFDWFKLDVQSQLVKVPVPPDTDYTSLLDDVFVPWENVFCYRNLQLCRDQWWRTPSHSYGNHQAQVRYGVKLRFLMGLTKRLCEITGIDPMPPVQIQLGEMAAFATIVDSMVQAQELQATVDAEGVVWPSKQALYSVMSLQSEINPRLLDIVRDLAGGSMIMLPSSVKDMKNPATQDYLRRYVRGSHGIDFRERIKIMKLLWDAIGTEFDDPFGPLNEYSKASPCASRGEFDVLASILSGEFGTAICTWSCSSFWVPIVMVLGWEPGRLRP